MLNQINTESFVNPEYQSKERIQAWIDAMADNKRYFFYIAVGLADSDTAYPLGNWNIPFYSIEEANQFKNEAQLKYPDCSFNFITGTLRIDRQWKLFLVCSGLNGKRNIMSVFLY